MNDSQQAAKTVHVYRAGLVHCSVCAPKDLSGPDVARGADLSHPTGLDHGWSVSSDTHFASGQTNPCQCEDDPERRHWLLSC